MCRMEVQFVNPELNYYDGRFATQFEHMLREKFTGLDSINEVPSDYIKRGLFDFKK
jgi:hypothetical protein